MSKQNEMEKLEQGWALLKASYDGLTDEQMVEPRVTGGWSVKDILAHITIWEQESLKYLPVILEGKRTPRYSDMYGGIDGFNAQMSEHFRELSVPQVLQQLEETHEQLIHYLEKAPEDQFGSGGRFQRRLKQDTYEHYADHAQAILEWRKIAPRHVASARDEKSTFDTDYPQNTEPAQKD